MIAAKEAFETGVETKELAASVVPEQVSAWVICFLAHIGDCRALLLLYCCTGAGVCVGHLAFGSLRPFGPVSGLNVARGSSVLYLTREGLCDTYICKLGSIQFQKTVKKVSGP